MSAETIQQFYEAFSRRDSETMNFCYHPKVQFSDPVFPDLKGFEVAAMWRMLCQRGKDLEIQFSKVKSQDDKGSALWQAQYTFSGTGNKVHNKIRAQFEFEGDKIIVHRDSFNLYAWCRQALGLKGKLLGWLPPVQNAVRAQAAKSLKLYIERENLKHSDFFPDDS